MRKVKIGIIGCGNISGIYFKSGKTFANYIEIAACADLDVERAKAKAEEVKKEGWCSPEACTVDQLLANPEIEIVVNLTIPKAHFDVAMKVVQAGKSVHNEKPLCLTVDQGRKLLAEAAARKVRVGCAPDTFLGGGHQTCRKLIDDGIIGTPVAAVAFMLCPGHESWHPAPEFYYQAGGGPMLDMGPYYITALVNMLGPVKRVSGSARISHPERLITSQPKCGTKIKVEVPTHVAGTLEFASGAIGTIITSFDVCAHNLPNIEIYGSEGSIRVPDPNGFGGPVMVKRAGVGNDSWVQAPLTHGYAENSRGVGPADMACAIRSGRKHRASGELAFHALEVMQAIHEAAASGRYYEMTSTVERPAPLPLDFRGGRIDE